MKKVIIFTAIVALLFGVMVYLSNANSTNIEGNIFGKDTLHRATLAQLDNPNYQNIILPKELEAMRANGESVFVYFYSPECQFCRATSPIVVPYAEELGIDLKLYNVLEFPEAFQQYSVRGTPEFVYFKNGEAITPRIHGALTEEHKLLFKDWVETVLR
jgi:thiol-disulfide isomerase/thioredoxin